MTAARAEQVQAVPPRPSHRHSRVTKAGAGQLRGRDVPAGRWRSALLLPHARPFTPAPSPAHPNSATPFRTTQGTLAKCMKTFNLPPGLSPTQHCPHGPAPHALSRSLSVSGKENTKKKLSRCVVLTSIQCKTGKQYRKLQNKNEKQNPSDLE